MIAYVTSLSVLIVAGGFLFGVRAGVMATLFAHPIAAAGWHANLSIASVKLNALVLIGLLVPFFVILRSMTKGPSFLKMPLAGIWIVYVCYNVFSGTFHAIDEGPGRALNLIFRHLAGFVGFYMLQAFFTDRTSFEKLLKALIASGIFPVAVILYQVVTGIGTPRDLSSGGDLRIEESLGLVRYSGFFHDIVSVRGYVFQCLTGIVLYWAYFVRPNRDAVVRAILAVLGMACLFVLYKMYSKAAVATLIAWLAIWCIGYRRVGLAVAIATLVLAINVASSDRILTETGKLFQLEVAGVQEGASEIDRKRFLHGRVGAWENVLADFGKATALEQMFGYRSAFGAHNDFLQKLLSGGYVGLMIYVVLLWKLGVRLARLNLRKRTPVTLMGAMVFSGWMIDTIGVVPSLYPGYQWYAWGLIGLAIKGLDFEAKPEAARGSFANRLEGRESGIGISNGAKPFPPPR